MRVLIVDDNEQNIYYLRTLLSAQGCEVQSARHGAEALIKARELPPALVISDLLMPVMDGYTLLRHWKSDERLRHIPFMVYTATYTDPEDEDLALKLGADAFILKPTSPEDFLVRFRALEAAAAKRMQVAQPVGNEEGRLREYNETLIRKLEQKMLQLEESNRQLQKDIAAREIAERAQRESEERFRQLAESIDDVFWLSDTRMQHVFYLSPAYEAIWGRSCETVYASSESWLLAVHPEDRERVRASLSAQAFGPWDAVYRIVRPDGSQRWIRARTCPVRNAHGEVYRVAGVARDITEYQRLEEQFRQAQKMEAVGRLAGGIAHDFNNLLSVILGYTSLALSTLKPDDRARNEMQEVFRAAERGADVTRQLLAFSRQQVLEPKVLDLGGVVIGMEKMLRPLLGEDITLSVLTPLEAVRVHADPSQIEQMIMNLAVNARDAMPSGGSLTIKVEPIELHEPYVSSHSTIEPGQYVTLTVADTGVGMDQALREQIFEPFFTTKEPGKGTGLGLSTVFGIAKQSRGHVHVDSESGRGTTFTIYLPRTKLEPEKTGSVPPLPSTLDGTETILLVEDDRQLRELNSVILREHGYNVLAAQDGKEAIALSNNFAGPIHLLLTDVVMPLMSGPALSDHLRPLRPLMKVLFVSGYARSSVAHHGLLEASLAFLQKPAKPDALLCKVRAVLVAGESAKL